MKIKKAEFAISAVSASQYPEGQCPEIALVGRSNVGKSSLINRFINRKNLARTSSQPGKTQTLNFYCINDSWYFVDLPGYGFAKVSKTIKAKWAQFIDAYLNTREQLKGVIMIVDLRHPPSNDDVIMVEWLQQRQLPILIVGTKADKINRGQWLKHKHIILKELKAPQEVPFIIFSAEKAIGVEELSIWLKELVPYEKE